MPEENQRKLRCLDHFAFFEILCRIAGTIQRIKTIFVLFKLRTIGTENSDIEIDIKLPECVQKYNF